ncbi:TPM domain-containing protein [Oceanobacillus luteolus]|uniref:TPM domain-containing protein n=1 Tax=Oceanobacillus luteolus TaxID=1274358 RepID=A0ABW4HMZ2_9BACI|nr:TPM domain-containing protein [Oceanobacillus luteolus]MCM3739825.1 TPM domain-containing protein [Oceanobacillus luteolus]
MKLLWKTSILFTFLFFLLISPALADVQRIYDHADLLTDEQVQELEKQAANYFEEWNTDFIIITTEDTNGKTIMKYMQDFTDELKDEFNRQEDNMAVITIDMDSRMVDIAGFGIAEKYIDDERIELILDHVTPYFSQGDYYKAFKLFFEKADEYLDIRPGVNPESVFFNTFFQLAVAVVLAAIIVFLMAYTSGGRVTVTSGTYLNRSSSRIISKRDRYLRKTVTRRKKPSANNNGGGGGFRGGGGGITGAGRSHSGGRRGF